MQIDVVKFFRDEVLKVGFMSHLLPGGAYDNNYYSQP